MSFQLELLNPHPGFKVTTYEDGRRTYSRSDVGYLPSVTTVLGQKLSNGDLVRWRQFVGDEEADRISGIAKTRGSAVHKLCEDYIMGIDPHDEKAMPNVRPLYRQLKRQLDAHVETIYGSEFLLYSKKLNTAGRCDLIATWNETKSVVDFKTANEPKKANSAAMWQYFYQATCYAMMVEELHQIKIPQIVVLVATEFEPEAQVFVRDTYPYRADVIKMFTGLG